jgi:hypothetical protein
VEIKESKQDDKNTGVQVFLFSINAEIAPSGPTAGTQTKTTSAPAPTTPAAPAKKG